MANKLTKLNIAAVSVLALAFFAFAGTGQAKASDLDVEFSNEPNPMFSAINFLPGDSALGWSTVLNTSSSAQKVIIWTSGTSNPVNGKGKKLGDVLKLFVTRRGETTPFYEKNVTNFLEETDNGTTFPPVKYLVLEDSLASGNSKTYDFKIYFESSAGNEYQGATAGFDLNIKPLQNGQNQSEPSTTRFSMGGGTPLFDFKILNVTSSVSTASGRNDATIEWDTNAEASTQIIYSRQDQPHTLTNNPPYYGYANVYPMPEDLNFTYHHQVFLSGLTPCSTYYYRVVSHRQGVLDTVSQPEQSFTTACPQQQQTQQQEGENENSFNNGQGSGLLAGNSVNPRVEGTSTENENNQGTTSVNGSGGQDDKNISNNPFDSRNLMASIANFFSFKDFGACWPNFPWWLFLLFAVYPILKGLDYWSEKRERSIAFFILSLIPIIIAFWAYAKLYVCLPWWLLLVMLAVSIIVWLTDQKRFSKKKAQ